jgi:uncharacterized delta-60 repeat protein
MKSFASQPLPPEERHLAETCGLDPAEAHRQALPKGGGRHIVAFVLAVLAIAPRVWAAPGDLDPSFHGTGVARTVIRGRPFAGASAIVRQDDGKLVVAGSSESRKAGSLTLVRYQPDGTRDKQFGSSGIVTPGRGKAAAAAIEAAAVVQQADGKLVVAGSRSIGGDEGYVQTGFALVRYDARGRLDPSFGAGTGTVTTPFGSEAANAYALVQQADGKLVAAGTTGGLGTNSGDLALVRYELDGSVDPSFGTGTVLTPGGGANALTQQADGKLLAAGYRSGLFYSFSVVRYDSNGHLDPEFGAGTGIVSTPLPGATGFSAILQQADGKIIAVGTATGTATSGGQSRFAVVRYDTDGSLDPTFGGGMGIVTTLVRGDAIATAAVQQPDGKIIVAGYSNVAPIIEYAGLRTKDRCGVEYVPCETQFTLVRYEIDGTLDKSFGAQNSGTVTSPAGGAIGLLQQPDGGLVAAGYSYVGKHRAITVVRYLD